MNEYDGDGGHVAVSAEILTYTVGVSWTLVKKLSLIVGSWGKLLTARGLKIAGLKGV